MPPGKFNINWPWSYYLRDQAPGPYEFPNSIQPVLDVRDGPVTPQIFTTSVALGVGATNITFPDTPAGRARVWTDAIVNVNILTATLFWTLRYTTQGQNQAMKTVFGGQYVAQGNMPLIRGNAFNITTGANELGRDPIRVARQSGTITERLILAVGGAAGTETAVINALFYETDVNDLHRYPVP